MAIALGFAQVADYVLDDFVRRLEPERRRVADVELDDAMPFFLQTMGMIEHRATNVVTDVCELEGFLIVLHARRSAGA